MHFHNGDDMSTVLDKAISLIDIVSSGHNSLSEITSISGFTRSTTHRILATLVAHGYLSLNERRYEIGYRFLELGEKKKKSLHFIQKIRPILERASLETNDTIHIAVLNMRDIILIERIVGVRPLQLQSTVGQRTPAYGTAVGKALISRLAPYQWSSYLQDIPRDYCKSALDIRNEFEAARRDRFAYDIDECTVGTCGVAATFKVSSGLTAAVSINGATVYFQDGRLQALGPKVVALAQELQTALARFGD